MCFGTYWEFANWSVCPATIEFILANQWEEICSEKCDAGDPHWPVKTQKYSRHIESDIDALWSKYLERKGHASLTQPTTFCLLQFMAESATNVYQKK